MPQHLNDLRKLVKRFARTEDIEFLQDEQLGLVGDGLLGIANVDDAAGVGYFFDCRAKRGRRSHGLNDDIRPMPAPSPGVP